MLLNNNTVPHRRIIVVSMGTVLIEKQMTTGFALMKTLAALANEDGGMPPNEAKSPIMRISSFFIPSFVKRLHSFIGPDRGDFIEKPVFW